MSKKLTKVSWGFAGGWDADAKKMMQPLMGIVVVAAMKIKKRAQGQGLAWTGRPFGRYKRKQYKPGKKNWWIWTRPNSPVHPIDKINGPVYARSNKGSNLVLSMGSVQSTRRHSAGRNINFSLTGDMWRGLATKAMKDGGRIATRFYKTGRANTGKAPWKMRNSKKAFLANVGFEHMLQPAWIEGSTMMAEIGKQCICGLIKNVQAKQKLWQQISREMPSDPWMNGKMDSTRKLRARLKKIRS